RPGGLAERIVPGRRCRDAVADVQIEALEQRQLAHRLAGGPRRRPRLRPLALGFDGLPWPAAALRSLPAFPHPAPAVLHPALADQGLGVPVLVLLDVVPVAARNAWGALSGSGR